MLKPDRAHTSLRERAKEGKLERIERAARRLFAKNGFEKTTTREIAVAARIATGTLFVYFPEKVELLVYLYRKDLERIMTSALDELPEGLPLVDACVRVFDGFYAFYETDIALARAFIKEGFFLKRSRQQGLYDVTVRFIERLAGLVAAAQARGEVRSDVAPPFVAYELFGRYFWGLTNRMTGNIGDHAQLMTMMRMSFELVVRGLEPAPRRESAS